MELEEGCNDSKKNILSQDEYVISTEDIMDVEVEGSTIIYSSQDIISGPSDKTNEIYHQVDENIKLLPNQTLVTKTDEYENEDGQPEVMQIIYV